MRLTSSWRIRRAGNSCLLKCGRGREPRLVLPRNRSRNESAARSTGAFRDTSTGSVGQDRIGLMLWACSVQKEETHGSPTRHTSRSHELCLDCPDVPAHTLGALPPSKHVIPAHAGISSAGARRVPDQVGDDTKRASGPLDVRLEHGLQCFPRAACSFKRRRFRTSIICVHDIPRRIFLRDFPNC